MPESRLIWAPQVGQPRAVVLVLPGGRSRSRQPVRAWQVAVLRMVPFAAAVAAAGKGKIAMASMRYAVRGWNGAEQSPLGDTRRALDEIEAKYPGVPIGLLGHSMGGRVALHLADDERVPAIVALAPWVEGQDRPRSHRGVHVLIMHGTLDRVTSPGASRAMARAMAKLGADVSYESVKGDSHAMLRQASRWHREAAAFLVGHLLGRDLTDGSVGPSGQGLGEGAAGAQ